MKKCLFALALILVVLPAHAVSFEITPFAGVRLGGDFDDFESPLIKDIEIENGASFGANLAVGIGENWQIEFIYSRQSTDLVARGTLPGKREIGIDVDYIHLGGLYQFRDSLDTIRPFFSFSLGSTQFDPEGNFGSENKFSFALGGGMKYAFNDRFGLRLQGRWVATEINDSDQVYCNVFNCFIVEETNFLNQIEFSVGLGIRFGN